MDTTIGMVLEAKGSRVHSTSPASPVSRAAALMAEKGVGALLVREGERLLGIVSERDLLNKVLARGGDPETIPVSGVMTDQVVAMGPDATVAQALRVVTEKRLRHLPVMEGERLLGLVSSGDLARWLVKDLELQIGDLVRFVQGDYPG